MNYKQLTVKEYHQLMGTTEGEQTNRIHLILSFIDFNFSPERFTEELQLQPLSTGIKGEEYLLPDGIRKRKRESSHWEYEWKINSNKFIGDYLTKFIHEVIEPRMTNIRKMNQDCITRLTVVQYYYTGLNIGMGFEREEIQILAAINAEVDMDLYILTKE